MKTTRLKSGAVAVAGALLALPLLAQGAEGLYVGIEAGANWQHLQHLEQAGFNFVNLDMDNPGYMAGIKAGWALPNGLRPELELSYRHNDLKSFTARLYDGGGSLDAKGSQSATSGFINLWYDFAMPAGAFGAIRPYLGAGIGLTKIRVNDMEAGGVRFGSASDTVGAYQLGAGVVYDLQPNLALSVDYRYLRTKDGNFGSIQNIPPGDVNARYSANTLAVGLNYRFK